MQRAFSSDIDSQSKILLTFVCFARLGIETKMAENITPKVCFQPVLRVQANLGCYVSGHFCFL